MAHFLFRLSYGAPAIKAMVEHPQSREDTARKAVESLGGKLQAFFFAFGAFDAIVLCDMPDNVSAAAVAMAVGAGGGLSKFETTVLMTAAQSVEAMQKAKAVTYAPPR